MIKLIALDWIIIAVFFTITISIGILSARKSAENEEEYFIGGRNMPWYLLGFSMVATTFSTDTPNLVTDLVRRYGVFGNWLWWSMLPTGMLTVFLYSKLWRRAGTVTDLEFYEMRYSGRAAAFLRGFRAVYLGLLFNIMVMATVSLAAIKIGAAMLGLTPVESVIYAMTGTVIFSSIGGFRGVIFSDFVLFILAMTGAVGAACIIVNQPEIGGLSGLASKLQAMDYSSHANMYSYQNKQDLYEVFLIPILIIWWSIWYPGAEPGGGGYQVQRMLAAKNENHAFGATLFFNISHYAIRPWPWILVALCSLVVFPDWNSMRQAIPPEILSDEKIQNDLAYSLMLTKLPAGWIGLVIASLLGAYMSTISTQLNWGASYLVNDCWKRFIRPGATQREMVWMGRVFTVILMILAGIMALMMTNALDSFQIM
ncbi:MAG: sodium:solute symporter family protein, partial [Victivallaceae bacterium]